MKANVAGFVFCFFKYDACGTELKSFVKLSFWVVSNLCGKTLNTKEWSICWHTLHQKCVTSLLNVSSMTSGKSNEEIKVRKNLLVKKKLYIQSKAEFTGQPHSFHSHTLYHILFYGYLGYHCRGGQMSLWNEKVFFNFRLPVCLYMCLFVFFFIYISYLD